MDYSILSKHRGKLMGVAALWIYIFHILPSPAYWEARGLDRIWWYIRNAGFCGVDMFLFLSGLGLAYSMEKRPIASAGDCLRFWGQRFFRIYGTFLPFALIFALLDGWGAGLLLRRLVCLDQFGGNLYNFCWYVCCILLLYLLAPALYRLVRRSGALTLALGAGYLAALYLLKGVIRSDLYAIAVRLPVFTLGLWTAKLSMDRCGIRWYGWVCGALMLGVGLALSFGLNAGLIPSPMPSGNALVNVLLAPALILLLSALFAWMEGRTWLAPAGKILTFFGTISFEFYLMQEWYVRRGRNVLPAQGTVRQVLVFGVMVALSVLLQKLSVLLKKLLMRN